MTEHDGMSADACARGCSRITGDGNREPLRARIGRLCHGCADRLERWLTEIPERYAVVPNYLTATTDLDRNPDAPPAKRTTAPPPLRVGALDLLDTRLGRKWLGTEPTPDRRGTLGVLLAVANELRESRGNAPLATSSVIHEANHLRHSLAQLAALDGISDIHHEIRVLHRDLGDAIGEYPPKPVGRCYVIPEDADDECGGPLMPSHSGVSCPRCGARWGHDELRRLGMALGEGA